MAILIPLDRLADNPWQTRQAYDQAYIREELAVSIARTGLLQVPLARLVDAAAAPVDLAPLLLMSQSSIDELLAANSEWRAQLAFAHTRRRAFDHLAGEAVPVPGIERAGHMPVELRMLSDEDMAEQALVENDKSRPINAVEEALAYQKRIDDFGYTHKDMAERYGKRRATISNKLRLLKLPRRLLDAVALGSLSERSAGAFVPFFTLAEPLSASVAALEDERWKNGKYQNYVVLDQLTDKACREGIGSEEVRHTFERLVRGASEKLEHFVPDEVFDLEGVRQAACQGCALLLKQKDRDEVNYRCGDPACFALKDEAATEAILKAASEACGLAITTCQDREQTASFWTGGSEAKLAKKLLKKGCPHDKLHIRISQRRAFTVPGHDQAELCCLHKGQGCPCQNPKAKASAAAQETRTGRAKARLLGEERYAAPAKAVVFEALCQQDLRVWDVVLRIVRSGPNTSWSWEGESARKGFFERKDVVPVSFEDLCRLLAEWTLNVDTHHHDFPDALDKVEAFVERRMGAMGLSYDAPDYGDVDIDAVADLATLSTSDKAFGKLLGRATLETLQDLLQRITDEKGKPLRGHKARLRLLQDRLAAANIGGEIEAATPPVSESWIDSAAEPGADAAAIPPSGGGRGGYSISDAAPGDADPFATGDIKAILGHLQQIRGRQNPDEVQEAQAKMRIWLGTNPALTDGQFAAVEFLKQDFAQIVFRASEPTPI